MLHAIVRRLDGLLIPIRLGSITPCLARRVPPARGIMRAEIAGDTPATNPQHRGHDTGKSGHSSASGKRPSRTDRMRDAPLNLQQPLPMDNQPTTSAPASEGRSLQPLVRRLAYRRHTDPRVLKMFGPNELQIGWEFEDSKGNKLFVKWGSNNAEKLDALIADVHARFGPVEVVNLDEPNLPREPRGSTTSTPSSND